MVVGMTVVRRNASELPCLGGTIDASQVPVCYRLKHVFYICDFLCMYVLLYSFSFGPLVTSFLFLY